jgi:hypothetical protein
MLSFGTWQKVAEVDVPSGSTAVTVNGLDGNADKAYLVVFQGMLGETTGSDVHLVAVPNNLSISASCSRFGYWWDGASNTGNIGPEWFTVGGLFVGKTTYNAACNTLAWAVLTAVTGYPRISSGLNAGQMPAKGSGSLWWAEVASQWNDTTTNITSLKIAVSANTFKGKILLFKVSG